MLKASLKDDPFYKTAESDVWDDTGPIKMATAVPQEQML